MLMSKVPMRKVSDLMHSHESQTSQDMHVPTQLMKFHGQWTVQRQEFGTWLERP